MCFNTSHFVSFKTLWWCGRWVRTWEWDLGVFWVQKLVFSHSHCAVTQQDHGLLCNRPFLFVSTHSLSLTIPTTCLISPGNTVKYTYFINFHKVLLIHICDNTSNNLNSVQPLHLYLFCSPVEILTKNTLNCIVPLKI